MAQGLTYDELAERLRIKRNAARVLAQRRGWPRITGNDGRARVLVPEDALPAPAEQVCPPHVPPDVQGVVLPDVRPMPPESTGEISALRAHIATLAEGLRRAEERADRLEEDLRRQADENWRLAGRIDELHEDRSREIAEYERLKAMLTERQRRPWWRRIVG